MFFNTPWGIAVIILSAIAVITALVLIFRNSIADLFHLDETLEKPEETEYERVGREGEEFAARVIRNNMREGDLLFNNVSVEYDGRLAEIDNVVVNRYGVFIIEVKNYLGDIYGGPDDYEWVKRRVTPFGQVYVKNVKNPLKQIRREVDILARYLRYYGVDVWVEGYVMMLEFNSPVDSDRILKSDEDIARVLHTRGRKTLNLETVRKIGELLSREHTANNVTA